MAVLDPRRRRRSTLILLLLTSITLLSLDYQGFRPLSSVQGAIRGVVDPASGSADSITSPFTNAWRSFTDFDDMEAENDELRAELAELRANAIEVAAAEEALRDLLDEIDIDHVGGAETIVAQVTERPGNFQSYSVEIDRGSNDGVRPNMPVVTSGGLVGRVESVQENFAEVRLLHQQDFKLGVRVIGSGEVSLAEGRGLGRDLEFTVGDGATENTDIEVGSPVVTSGIQGSSFPPDIAVGVVSEVEFDSAALELRVRVEPVADLQNLRFVTVILWTVDGESAS
ncbi:MAG: rod shape-determining protein MreC [Actinomycetota bacterium]